jgi:hypothetical protein
MRINIDRVVVEIKLTVQQNTETFKNTENMIQDYYIICN